MGKKASPATPEPKIATASVTVRVLQVGQRSMSQSFFRQLPLGALLDEETFRVNGSVWGWVNHDWGLIPGQTNFVVLRDSRLFRCPYWLRKSAAFKNPKARPLPYCKILTDLDREGVGSGKRAANYRRRWDALMETLEQIEQLFIAL